MCSGTAVVHVPFMGQYNHTLKYAYTVCLHTCFDMTTLNVSTFIQDPNKRFGAALGALSGGRVGIIGMCTANLKSAISISIRYSGARRQFGPKSGEEIPVLEYQLQVR